MRMPVRPPWIRPVVQPHHRQPAQEAALIVYEHESVISHE